MTRIIVNQFERGRVTSKVEAEGHVPAMLTKIISRLSAGSFCETLLGAVLTPFGKTRRSPERRAKGIEIASLSVQPHLSPKSDDRRHFF